MILPPESPTARYLPSYDMERLVTVLVAVTLETCTSRATRPGAIVLETGTVNIAAFIVEKWVS